MFSIKSSYCKAIAQADKGPVVNRLIGSVWQNIAPPKVEFMVWLTLLGKLNTKDMLPRKGTLTEEENYCTFCNTYIEDLYHLLITCPVSWRTWNAVANDLGQTIATPINLVSFHENWVSRKISNKV